MRGDITRCRPVFVSLCGFFQIITVMIINYLPVGKRLLRRQ